MKLRNYTRIFQSTKNPIGIAKGAAKSGYQNMAAKSRMLLAATLAGFISMIAAPFSNAQLLGSAENFTVISAAGVTSSGFTVINGDVGLSPLDSIIGFTFSTIAGPGVVNGTVYYNASTQAPLARTDAQTGYNTLAGMAYIPANDLTGLDLGGMSLSAGVYHFDTSAGLTGNLTIDNTLGNASSVYVFQIGSTLDAAVGSSVTILGVAPIIYWQVGSSATINTGSSFNGNIVALASVSFGTGAGLVNGRAIALTGAVTLLGNSITNPNFILAGTGRYWNGSTSNLWSALNWSSTVAGINQANLAVNADVVFSVDNTNLIAQNQNTILDVDTTISGLTVNDPMAVTIGGTNTLTISSVGLPVGININASAGLTTIGANLILGNLSQIITVNNVNGLLISGVVGGTNGLTKAGSGLLTLTGTETYTGDTLITGGTLQIGDGITAGASIASSSLVTVDSGSVLAINLADGETFTNSVTDNGQIQWIASGTNYQDVNSVFSGTGDMEVNALGTAVILGSNTYTGSTLITNGTLQIGDGITAGASIASSSLVTVDSGSVLAIDLANGETFTNSVTDNGQIQWIASGTNYQDVNSVFSGTGDMLITATGTTVLLGTNTFSGGTTIDTSGIVLADNSASYGSGTLTINDGYVDTNNSQSLQINVSDYDQSGGTIAMHIAGTTPGSYTQYNVADTVVLSGGEVFVYDASGSYVPLDGDTQNIITSANSLSGVFDSNSPFSQIYSTALGQDVFYHQGDTLLYPTITYDYFTADVYVTWVQDAFSSLLDLTRNQTSASNMLDVYQNNNPLDPDGVSTYLGAQPIANLPGLYDLIAPDELTSIFQIGFSNAEIQNLNIERHLELVRQGYGSMTEQPAMASDSKSGLGSKGGMPTQVRDTPSGNQWTTFIEGNGGSASVDSDGNGSAYSFDTTGITIGADRRINDHLVFGVLGSYGRTDAGLTNGGHLDVDTYKGAIYATAFSNGFYVDALLGAGYNEYDSKRSSLTDYATGNTDGWELDALINVGYDYRYNQWKISPMASIAYTRVNMNSFTETGSMTPLSYPDQAQESLRSNLGAEISYAAMFRGMTITPQVRLSWQHEFLDNIQTIDSQFASGSGSTFTVWGPDMNPDRALISAGLSIQITPDLCAYAYYDGQLGNSRYNANSVTAGIKLDF